MASNNKAKTRKGFLKLSNEEIAIMDEDDDDSGSEIELLDMSQLDNNTIQKGQFSKRSRRGSGCGCCTCCMAFYIFLLTLSLALAILFGLYLAYNIQLLKLRLDNMDSSMSDLKKDLQAFRDSYKKQYRYQNLYMYGYLGENITSLSSSITRLTSDMSKMETRINGIQHDNVQTSNDWVQIVNKNMTAVSTDVHSLATTVAHFSSILDSLGSQFKATKKYCGDFGGQIEGITTKTADTSDELQSLKTEIKARNNYVDRILSTMNYAIGNISTNESNAMSAYMNKLLIIVNKFIGDNTTVEGKARNDNLDLLITNVNYYIGNITTILHKVNWTTTNTVSLNQLLTRIINMSTNATSTSYKSHVEELAEMRKKLQSVESRLNAVMAQLENLSHVTTPTHISPSKSQEMTTPTQVKPHSSFIKIHKSSISSSSLIKTSKLIKTTPIPVKATPTPTEASPIVTTESAAKNDSADLGSGNEATPPTTTTEKTTPTKSKSKAEKILQNILDSFDALDIDSDGELTSSELNLNSKVFHILDKDGDGGLSKEEIKSSLYYLQNHHQKEEKVPEPEMGRDKETLTTPNYDYDDDSQDEISQK